MLRNQSLEHSFLGAGAQRGTNTALAGTGHGFSEMHALSIFGVKVWALNIEKIRRETLQDLARQLRLKCTTNRNRNIANNFLSDKPHCRGILSLGKSGFGPRSRRSLEIYTTVAASWLGTFTLCAVVPSK